MKEPVSISVSIDVKSRITFTWCYDINLRVLDVRVLGPPVGKSIVRGG